MKMCRINLTKSAEAIQLVLSKVKLTEKIDLDDIRNILNSQLMTLVE